MMITNSNNLIKMFHLGKNKQQKYKRQTCKVNSSVHQGRKEKCYCAGRTDGEEKERCTILVCTDFIKLA